MELTLLCITDGMVGFQGDYVGQVEPRAQQDRFFVTYRPTALDARWFVQDTVFIPPTLSSDAFDLGDKYRTSFLDQDRVYLSRGFASSGDLVQIVPENRLNLTSELTPRDDDFGDPRGVYSSMGGVFHLFASDGEDLEFGWYRSVFLLDGNGPYLSVGRCEVIR